MESGSSGTAPAPGGVLARLTNGRLLARNMAFSLAGQILPLFVALAAIPLLIRELGTARFGVLTLGWVLVGYFSFLDLGMGRALTKIVAERLGAGQSRREIAPTALLGLAAMLVIGLAGALAVVLIAPALTQRWLNVPGSLQRETLTAFYLLAPTVPLVIMTTGLRGILQAYQRFGFISVVRAVMGVALFLGPLAVAFVHPTLPAMFITMFVVRLVAWALHVWLCRPYLRRSRNRRVFAFAELKALLGFGSWITVSNVISPMLSYWDRFFIGAWLSVTAVTFYVTPFEVVTKLLFIPGAVAAVLFPAFSMAFTKGAAAAGEMLERGCRYIGIVMFPLALVTVAFAHEGLLLWLDAEFAEHSTPVLQWLAIGVFANSLAYMPFALLQGVGRPDIPAKFHLIQIVPYIVALKLAIDAFGIAGVAMVWTARVTIDLAGLLFMAEQVLDRSAHLRRASVMAGVAIAVLFVVMAAPDLWTAALIALVALAVYGAGTWRFALDASEKLVIQRVLSRGSSV